MKDRTLIRLKVKINEYELEPQQGNYFRRVRRLSSCCGQAPAPGTAALHRQEAEHAGTSALRLHEALQAETNPYPKYRRDPCAGGISAGGGPATFFCRMA